MNGTRLVADIREAFRGVKLEGGVSLNMTEYHDSSGMAKHFEELAKDDERDDWQKIDDKTLEQFTVTFSFTDWKGFRFYLPAYMTWAIRHPESTSIICEHTIYALNPHSILTLYGRTVDQILNRQQMEVAVRFLEYYVEELGYSDVDTVANLNGIRKCL